MGVALVFALALVFDEGLKLDRSIVEKEGIAKKGRTGVGNKKLMGHNCIQFFPKPPRVVILVN